MTLPSVAFNGHFLDRPFVGTGQYSVRLLEWLPKVAPLTIEAVPGGAGGALRKLLFEQIGFVRGALSTGAGLWHVPYLGPPLFQSKPTVVTVHDVIMLALPEHRGPLSYRLYTHLALAGARRARRILADSAATRQDLIRLAGFDPRQIDVVPLAVNERFRPNSDRSALEALRNRYQLPERFLLYLGGFDNRKNVPLLLRSVFEAGGKWPIAIAGNPPPPRPPLYPDIRKAAAPLGDRIRWLGRIADEDLPLLYNAATAFVYPSRYEGFGLPPLEALASGTAVIVADASSLPEVVGDAAIRVPVDNGTALAGAIQRVMTEDDFRRQLSQRGPEHARAWTWERTARLTLASYEHAIA